MGAVNKCRSAVLTNRLSSGTRCHRGTAGAPQRSLCVASHSHPSSQLIRLIFTSITAVSHAGKRFHWRVCVSWNETWSMRWACTSVLAQYCAACVCAGQQSVKHLSQLCPPNQTACWRISQPLLGPNVWNCISQRSWRHAKRPSAQSVCCFARCKQLWPLLCLLPKITPHDLANKQKIMSRSGFLAVSVCKCKKARKWVWMKTGVG